MKHTCSYQEDSLTITGFSHPLTEQRDTVSIWNKPEEDFLLTYTPEKQLLPYHLHSAPHYVLENLIYTIAFLIIFAFIRLRGKNLLDNLLNVLLHRKKVAILLNESISSNLVYYMLSLCLSLSALSTSITYLAWHKFSFTYSFYLFCGLFFYHFFLIALIRILGWTFQAKNAAIEGIANLWCYQIMNGLFISPFLIAIFFIKPLAIPLMVNMILFSFLILIIIKIIRWLEILTAYRVSIFYMILYLCAFEIMPLFILFKIVS